MAYKIIIACLFLCSCSASRTIETDLYFAQSRPDGSLITDAEWNNFKETEINKVFQKGMTTISVTGNWYDPDAHKLITEHTYLVRYNYKRSAQVSAQIDSLKNRYVRMFRQQSVLRVDKKVNTYF